MSIKNVGVLAFASAAVAAGHGHYQHNRLHARGTGAGAAPAIPTGLPACWGTCFQQAGVSGPEALCDNDEASNCIKTTCATADAASYEAWLQKQCNAPYPVGNNSTAVGPTATGGYTSVPSGGYSTSICTETSTLIYKTTTAYSTYLITHTLFPSGSASSDVSVGPATESTPAAGGYGSVSSSPASPTDGSATGGDDDECSEVTVTTTERTTVTVTAGEGSAPSSAPAPSSEGSGVIPSSAPATSSEESPVAPSSYVSEAGSAASSWAAPSSYAAPSSAATSSDEVSPVSGSSAASSATSSSVPTYDSGFRGKKGIAYNDSSMIVPAMTEASKVGWAFNWEGVAKGFESSDITYIPTLHSGDSYWTGMWKEQAEAAISAGLPYLFGPNEPDMSSQANMSPEDCATFWKTWMEPYAGRIGLVAPSVTSAPAGSGMGQDWLDQFMGNCSTCTIDAVNQHWYNSEGNDVDNFKDVVNGASKYGHPIFVGEFGAIGSESDISSFLNEVMPFMDDKSDVIGYAYFMAYPGLLTNGDGLSSYGETYCTGS